MRLKCSCNNEGNAAFACSESVKFGHVTFFWNGNRSGYFDEKYEKYVEIATDKGIQVKHHLALCHIPFLSRRL